VPTGEPEPEASPPLALEVDPGPDAIAPDLPPTEAVAPGPEPPPPERPRTKGWQLGMTRRMIGHLEARVAELDRRIAEAQARHDEVAARRERVVLERTRARIIELRSEAAELEVAASAEGTLDDAQLSDRRVRPVDETWSGSARIAPPLR
jgi:hypothetical protein